jgi:hypothetical protein
VSNDSREAFGDGRSNCKVICRHILLCAICNHRRRLRCGCGYNALLVLASYELQLGGDRHDRVKGICCYGSTVDCGGWATEKNGCSAGNC